MPPVRTGQIVDPRPNGTSDPTYVEPQAIIDASNLSELAKYVLRLVTRIPPGHYTSCVVLKDHIWDYRHICPISHIQAALRKNPAPEIIPCHRVVVKNEVGRNSEPEWGNHGSPVEERIERLKQEGIKFDKDGRLLGSAFSNFGDNEGDDLEKRAESKDIARWNAMVKKQMQEMNEHRTKNGLCLQHGKPPPCEDCKTARLLSHLTPKQQERAILAICVERENRIRARRNASSSSTSGALYIS